MDNVAAAIVDNGITLLLIEDKPLDEEAINKALTDSKISVTETKKADQLPF